MPKIKIISFVVTVILALNVVSRDSEWNSEIFMEMISTGKTEMLIRNDNKIKLYLDLAWDMVWNGFKMAEKYLYKIQNLISCDAPKMERMYRTNAKKNRIFICQDKNDIILFHESSICLLLAVLPFTVNSKGCNLQHQWSIRFTMRTILK